MAAAPGRMDDMRHAEAVYNFLEALLRHYKTDAEAEQMCKGLHELGFWVCLPHVVIERAYSGECLPLPPLAFPCIPLLGFPGFLGCCWTLHGS